MATRTESREQGIGTKEQHKELNFYSNKVRQKQPCSKEDWYPTNQNSIANVFVCELTALLYGREVIQFYLCLYIFQNKIIQIFLSSYSEDRHRLEFRGIQLTKSNILMFQVALEMISIIVHNSTENTYYKSGLIKPSD